MFADVVAAGGDTIGTMFQDGKTLEYFLNVLDAELVFMCELVHLELKENRFAHGFTDKVMPVVFNPTSKHLQTKLLDLHAKGFRNKSNANISDTEHLRNLILKYNSAFYKAIR